MVEPAGAVLGLGVGTINIVTFARFPLENGSSPYQSAALHDLRRLVPAGVVSRSHIHNPRVHPYRFQASLYAEYHADGWKGYIIEFALACASR